ncbi:unnamed protein product [Closterium sp. NIES-64]|nr:unnamed protein product [Closterium sp. NIES-64]
MTPAATSSVAVKPSPVGRMPTKAAGEKVRDQCNGMAAGAAVCAAAAAAAAGKATLGRVEAARGRAAGVGSGSGRGGGGATLIPQPGQSRAAHTAAAAKAVQAAPHSTRKPAAPAAAVAATRIPTARPAATSAWRDLPLFAPCLQGVVGEMAGEVEACGQLEGGL